MNNENRILGKKNGRSVLPAPNVLQHPSTFNQKVWKPNRTPTNIVTTFFENATRYI